MYLLDLQLTIDPALPPPQVDFCRHYFLKARYIRNILTLVHALAVWAFRSYSSIKYVTQEQNEY